MQSAALFSSKNTFHLNHAGWHSNNAAERNFFYNKFLFAVRSMYESNYDYRITDVVTAPGTFVGNSILRGVLLTNNTIYNSIISINTPTTTYVYDPIRMQIVTTCGSFTNTATALFSPGVLMHNGMVYCSARSSTYSFVYDPYTNTIFTPSGTFPGTTNALAGSVLMRDRRILIIAGTTTNFRIYDPVTDTLSTPSGTFSSTTSFKFHSGVLLSDGRVYIVPATDSSIALIYNPITDSFSTPAGTFTGSLKFSGGVLLPDGRVFLIARTIATFYTYDPVSDTIQSVGTDTTSNKTWGGVLLPNGHVLCTPRGATTAYIFNPFTNTLTTFGSFPANTMAMPTLLPNGNVYAPPGSVNSPSIIFKAYSSPLNIGFINSSNFYC